MHPAGPRKNLPSKLNADLVRKRKRRARERDTGPSTDHRATARHGGGPGVCTARQTLLEHTKIRPGRHPPAADVGYGMTGPGGRGTGTPYAGLTQSGVGYRALRYGCPSACPSVPSTGT